MKQIFLFLLLFSGCILTNLPAQTASPGQEKYICPPCGDGSCDKEVYNGPGICSACGMALIKANHLKNVAIFLYDGVELLDFSGPGEVFAAASGYVKDGGFRVFTVAATHDPIVSQGFVKVLPEYSIHDCPRPDIMVLPGGGTRESINNPAVIDWVKENSGKDQIAFSVCTGAFILAKAGVLDGKKATTWYGAIDRFKKSSPNTEVLADVRWVDNGNVITTAGVSAGIDGALHVVSRLYGEKTAIETAKYMEYEGWKPKGGVEVKQ